MEITKIFQYLWKKVLRIWLRVPYLEKLFSKFLQIFGNFKWSFVYVDSLNKLIKLAFLVTNYFPKACKNVVKYCIQP